MITKEVEKIFLETAVEMAFNQPTARCLLLKFSQLQHNKEEWLPGVIATIQEFSDLDIEDIYLCHDDDIFILDRTWTYKKLDNLLAHLAPKLKPALPTEISARELATLFEMGIDRHRIETICKKKIENLKLLQAQTNAKNTTEGSHFTREDAFNTLDENLIRTISTRRKSRHTPEIMIVEDDPFSQRLVDNALNKTYSVSVTSDGQGAIMNYINKAPDVLFLDIGLPDIDGHTVLKKLFEIDPNAFVVMLSGNGDRENVLRAIELGAKGFVGKPFAHEKLFQYINKSPFIQSKQKEKTHGNLVS